jgi:hypothetical protein
VNRPGIPGAVQFFDPGQEQRIEAGRRVHAGYAVRNALWLDPLMAALHSVYEASLAVSDKEGFFQDVIAIVHNPR